MLPYDGADLVVGSELFKTEARSYEVSVPLDTARRLTSENAGHPNIQERSRVRYQGHETRLNGDHYLILEPLDAVILPMNVDPFLIDPLEELASIDIDVRGGGGAVDAAGSTPFSAPSDVALAPDDIRLRPTYDILDIKLGMGP